MCANDRNEERPRSTRHLRAHTHKEGVGDYCMNSIVLERNGRHAQPSNSTPKADGGRGAQFDALLLSQGKFWTALMNSAASQAGRTTRADAGSPAAVSPPPAVSPPLAGAPPAQGGQPSPVRVRLIGSTVVDKQKAYVTYTLLAMSKRTTRGGGSDILSLPSEAGVNSVLVQRRFNEFVALRSKLAPLARKSKIALPQLPAKTFRRSATAAFTAKRQEALQLWLRQVSATLWCGELERFLGLAMDGSAGRPSLTQSQPSPRRSSYWPSRLLSYLSGRRNREHVGALALAGAAESNSASGDGRLVITGPLRASIGGGTPPSLMRSVTRLWRIALASDDDAAIDDPTDDTSVGGSSSCSGAGEAGATLRPPMTISATPPARPTPPRVHRRSCSWSPASNCGVAASSGSDGAPAASSATPAVATLARSSSSVGGMGSGASSSSTGRSSGGSGNGSGGLLWARRPFGAKHRRSVSNGSTRSIASVAESQPSEGLPSELPEEPEEATEVEEAAADAAVEVAAKVEEAAAEAAGVEAAETADGSAFASEGCPSPLSPKGQEPAGDALTVEEDQTAPQTRTPRTAEGSASSSDGSAPEATAGDAAVRALDARPLRLGPFLDATLQTLFVVDRLGPFWLAVKNDQANASKLKAAWAKLAKGAGTSELGAAAPAGPAVVAGPSGAISTLRALLAAELASGVHGYDSSCALADPSAAIALVWLRRSLTFLCHVLGGISSDREASVSELARAAYRVEMETMHCWWIRKTFYAGFGAMPSREDFLRRLAPSWRPEHGEASRDRELAQLVEVLREGLARMGAHLSAFSLDDRGA